MSQPAQERVLVYDRIDANRRATRRLLVLFAIVFLPVAGYLAIYLMLWVALFLAMAVAGFGLADIFSGDEGSLIAFGAVDAAISVLILVAVAYLQFRYAAALVLRFARARPLAEDGEPELRRTVENLCIGAGLPQPRLYTVESAAPNAFAAGLDAEHASLAVTRGLLELLDRRELEGVIAHELSHIGNGDTRLSTVLAAGVALLRLPFVIVAGIIRFLFRVHWALGWGLLLYLGLPILVTIPFGISVADDFWDEDPLAGVIFIFSMLLPFYIFVGAPLIAHFLRVGVMRQREFLADADAALLTRGPESLARALAKIGAAGQGRSRAGGAAAHLYIVDPISGDAPWWDRLLSTHPPVEERIAVLGGMGGGTPPSVLQAAEEAGARFRASAAATSMGRPEPLVAPAVDEEGESDRGRPLAFRLMAPAALYERADRSARQLSPLPAGALVTVTGEEGDFLHVIAPDDSFGYVLRSSPMTELEVPGTGRAGLPAQEKEGRAAETEGRGAGGNERGSAQTARVIVAAVVVFALVWLLNLAVDVIPSEWVPCISTDGC